MKKWCGILVMLVLIITRAVNVSAEGASTLETKIEQVLQHKDLKGAISSISIKKAKSGEVLYEKNSSVRMKIASNMKLFTGAAALETLGEEYKFHTELWHDGKVKNGVLKGNLYLKGKGDPTLGLQELQQFSALLHEKGIKKIAGNIIGDETWYDDVRLSEDMIWKDESYAYGAQISALTFSPDYRYEAGTVIVETTPTKNGKKAHISISPKTDYVRVMNETKTGKGETDLEIVRKRNGNVIVVKGIIKEGEESDQTAIAVEDPALYTTSLFKDALEKNGIKVTGKVKKEETPQKAQLMGVKESPPLGEIFIPYMKLSNNTIAEIFVKEMGKVQYGEGSFEAGLTSLNQTLSEMDVNVDNMMIRDGSGLSHVSGVPTDEISSLLFHARQKPWYDNFYESLPLAGDPDELIGGTLDERMRGTAAEGNVRAKTGSITGASSLSGYVTTEAGEELIFSIVFNAFLAEDVKDIEDEIAVILASLK
ncbi:D-alanyl-D-alanine carboxypeptidase/D-alanyl-D-alanine-endopeptidase [Priestia filamentosa]|uniref:D-alanyl-D-alanine carboxypeptidase/D-alanyl-D-alanine-endopeptidase n=1 Tax=Priestia filamentosa TaxID=1402861 RepID=A0A0H4KZ25_9BACI|nr:D-alanyl-D-alanine carboxypeptidase/D-alanyl-D-alanine-endopeptidase [Priestia filamentosa]AKO93598.1 D-alanyl-D-alanine carboxypeptidase/D-alanyl-D-alanine-endopeptidase [Priestia filamentosa]